MKQESPNSNPHPFGNKYDWSQKELISTGPLSSVYKLLHLQKGDIQCVKVVQADIVTLKQIKKHIDRQSNLQNENLVKTEAQLMENKLFLRMPLFGANLKEAMEKKPATPNSIINFVQKIVEIMNSPENGTLIHGNLKPSNIFVTDKEFHLSDLGFHSLYDQKQSELLGVGIYSAPQFILSHRITKKSDVWSFGLMLYEMVFGYLPWPHRNLKSYKSYILKYPLSFPFDANIGSNLKDFIEKCLVIDEHQRMSWEMAASHPLVVEGQLGDPTTIFHMEYYQKVALQLLLKLQSEIVRKNKSVKRVLQSAEKHSFNIEYFKKVCLEFTNHISEEEINTLFQVLKANDGCGRWKSFRRMLLEIDFRSKNNLTSRFMKQLSEMAIHKEIEIDDIKKLLKQGPSQLVTFPSFHNIVTLLLPQMPPSDIHRIWSCFQKQHNKTMKSQQMMQNIQCSLLKKQSKTERQKINVELQNFKQSFQEYGNVTVKDIVSFFDKNQDKMIGFGEFNGMVNSLFKYVPLEDLKMMFDDIDRDHSGKISAEEIKEFLRSR